MIKENLDIRRMGVTNVLKYLVFTGVIFIILFYLPVLFLAKDSIIALTHEDALYEDITAIFFFFAAIVFFYNFLKAKKRNLFFLLFALAFFFAAGEEISWGQRVFHFATPAAMASMNAQKEFNIHNLTAIQHERGISYTIKSLLNFNRMFIMFWAVYCILVPIANRYSSRIRSLFSRIRLPIVSLWIGMLFLFNEVLCKALELTYVARLPYDPSISEIKEAIWGLLTLFMGVYFVSLLLAKESARQESRAPQEPA